MKRDIDKAVAALNSLVKEVDTLGINASELEAIHLQLGSVYDVLQEIQERPYGFGGKQTGESAEFNRVIGRKPPNRQKARGAHRKAKGISGAIRVQGGYRMVRGSDGELHFMVDTERDAQAKSNLANLSRREGDIPFAKRETLEKNGTVEAGSIVALRQGDGTYAPAAFVRRLENDRVALISGRSSKADTEVGIHIASIEMLSNAPEKHLGNVDAGYLRMLKDAALLDASMPAPRGADRRGVLSREAEREMCMDLVSRHGAAIVYASIPNAVAGRTEHHLGWQYLADSERFPQFGGRYNPSQMGDTLSAAARSLRNLANSATPARGGFSGDVLEQHQRAEFVGFSTEREEIIDKVTIPGKIIPGKHKLMGLKKEQDLRETDKIEFRHTGKYKQVMHSELVKGGVNEPLVWMLYSADSQRVGKRSYWTDESHRPGQALTVAIALPESDAKTLQETLTKDPALVREIAAMVIRNHVLKDYPWVWGAEGGSASLHPPYRIWDSAPGGGKIYVQPLGARGSWNEEFDRPI